MRVLLENEPGTQLERTFRILTEVQRPPTADISPLPEPVTRMYLMLGDFYGTPGVREVRLATEKQLSYAAHLAGLDDARAMVWWETARGFKLDMGQVGHIIGKLRAEPPRPAKLAAATEEAPKLF